MKHGRKSDFVIFERVFRTVSFIISENKKSIASAKYYNNNYIAAIEDENVFGVQFHVEKSRNSGLKIIKNFINI